MAKGLMARSLVSRFGLISLFLIPGWILVVRSSRDYLDKSQSEGHGERTRPHVYDNYHAKRGSKACEACKHLDAVTSIFPCAKSIYDAGAGNCMFARELKQRGYDVRGTEFARLPLEKFCRDLVDDSIIFHSSLVSIPFRDDSFDLVTSFEVLEHVPEPDVDKAVAELVRVSKGHIFATISLRRSVLDPPYPEDAHIHVTVRQRSWWDAKFRRFGCAQNEYVHNLLQKKSDASSSLKTKAKFVKSFGVGSPEGAWEGDEVEPWYFIYTCKGKEFNLPSCDNKCMGIVKEAYLAGRIAHPSLPQGNFSCDL